MFLIVGLGNPGDKYKNNRHNVGYMFIDYMIKWLNCFLTTFIILIIFGRHIVYSANFSIDQEINYTCNVQLKCKVASNIKLTNNTKDYFVSDYKMILGLKNISNVSSVIKNNAILTEIQEEDDYKTILVRFDKPVLGVGELADFSVNFETEDIVKKVGRIYEINIPKVNKTEEIKNTSVNVFIPSSYGPLMYVSPKPNSVTKNDLVKYSFLNNQIYNDGVSIALGDFQIFNFFRSKGVFTNTHNTMFSSNLNSIPSINNNLINIFFRRVSNKTICFIKPKVLRFIIRCVGKYIFRFYYVYTAFFNNILSIFLYLFIN